MALVLGLGLVFLAFNDWLRKTVTRFGSGFCYRPRYWVPFLPWLAIATICDAQGRSSCPFCLQTAGATLCGNCRSGRVMLPTAIRPVASSRMAQALPGLEAAVGDTLTVL